MHKRKDQVYLDGETELTVVSKEPQKASIEIPKEIPSNTEYCFTVENGLYNPTTEIEVTSSFIFEVSTPDDYLIARQDSGILAHPPLSNLLCPGIEISGTRWWDRFLLIYICPEILA